ncbi:MAG: TIGR00282 family metallophosphoesterase [Rickettsiales bacterium]|nr:TIGR00282 family metallophosphoesterase [Rickettsiales bacterium]
MRILFCGDVVGRAGRDVITKRLPALKSEYKIDAAIVNVDNAAGGFGVTTDCIKQMKAAGADILTGGDHIWDQKDSAKLIENDAQLLRPHNFPEGTPGSGCRQYTLQNGKKLVVLHLLGQVFHKENLDCPFNAATQALQGYRIGHNVDAILVDMHCEATSEKNAMGYFLDGKVSAVVGSHTHIPTADARILPGGTAYQTDTGMCGNYNSIIGFDQQAPMQQFLKKMRKIRMEPAKGNGTLAAIMVELSDDTGLATHLETIQTQ